MNYKITTIILAIALVLLVGRELIKTNDATDNSSNSDEESSQKSIAALPDAGANIGGFISPAEAQTMLNDFFTEAFENDPRFDPKTTPYGFMFGINKMEEMLQQIRDYNTANKDPELAIVATRVYYAMKQVKPDSSYNDVFLIPVVKKGFKDLYPINRYMDDGSPGALKLDDGGPRPLNASLPCPPYCNP